MTQVTQFGLGFNALTGSLPTELALLTKADYFVLSGTHSHCDMHCDGHTDSEPLTDNDRLQVSVYRLANGGKRQQTVSKRFSMIKYDNI